ncbi:MAG: hypothetical protein KGZ37_04550 [Nitrosarchaeum sp.]|nr:hypothetical protein [Nitrosarchaeum sp.]
MTDNNFVNADPIQQFGFDQHPYVANVAVRTHGGLMFYDPSLAGNGGAPDHLTATLDSYCYNPFTVDLYENNNLDDGWLYSKRIIFKDSQCSENSSTPPDTSGDFNMDVKSIEPTEILYATIDSLGVSLSDSSNILPLQTGSLQWAAKRNDGNYADCTAAGGDVDEDAICDNFENGPVHHLEINYPPGASSYIFNDTSPLGNCEFFAPNPCSGSDMKDLWIEFDYMRPFYLNDAALKDVRAAFWNSPNQKTRVHFIVDEAIPWKEYLKPGGLNHPTLFGTDQVKSVYFGSPSERNISDWSTNGWKQKKQVFHYGLSIDKQQGSPTSSGFGELLGNDFGISYGGWPSGIPTHRAYQSGTIMHELGHNLGLSHGGSYLDAINCKPNLVSVMSYSRQLPTIFAVPLNDYSRGAFSSLDESSLNESTGVGILPPEYSSVTVVYGPTPKFVTITSNNEPIDWNQNNIIDSNSVQVDTNYLTSEGCTVADIINLVSYDEWDALNFDSRGTANFADGRMTSPCKFDPTGIANPTTCLPVEVPPGNAMGKNQMSKYVDNPQYPNWDQRIWIAGHDEITYDIVKAHLISNVLVINSTIQAFDDSVFLNKPEMTKNYYKNQMNIVLNAIDNNNYISSSNQLIKILETFDGKNNDDLLNPHFVSELQTLVENSYLAQKDLGVLKKSTIACDKFQLMTTSGECLDLIDICPDNQILDGNGMCISLEQICSEGTKLIGEKCVASGTIEYSFIAILIIAIAAFVSIYLLNVKKISVKSDVAQKI